MARNFIATDEEVYQQSYCKRYFSKDEIEYHSPSRKDAIKYADESHLRKLYCSFLQELGMSLKLPQVTIATSMIFCHRFYMSQSHAKNDWQTVATACMFLASKAEDTPHCLSDLLVVAYKLMYKWDPVAPQRIRQKEIYNKQKDIVLQAEILLLATLAFDFNVEQPYKPLVAAVRKLGLLQNDIMKVSWNFVNDWLRTTLCLQYKPSYIAAGSLFLASKLQKVKLPSTKGNTWWMQFDVSPKQLEEVIQQMVKILEQNQKPVQQTMVGRKVAESKQVSNGTLVLSSPESCVSDGSVVTPEVRNVSPVEAEGSSQFVAPACNHTDNAGTERCGMSGCSSTNSIVEIAVSKPIGRECDPNSGCRTAPMEMEAVIDVYGIKERLKKRKVDRQTEKRSDIGTCDDVKESDSWIEREIEGGIQKSCTSPKKRTRTDTEEIVVVNECQR